MLPENENNKRTDYTGLKLLALVLPVMVFFSFLGRDDIGRAVSVCLGSIMLAIKIRWDLRKDLWFWVVIVSVLLLHLPIFIFVQWPNGRVPPLVLLPFAVGDCLIVLGTVKIIEKYILKVPPPETSSDQ